MESLGIEVKEKPVMVPIPGFPFLILKLGSICGKNSNNENLDLY